MLTGKTPLGDVLRIPGASEIFEKYGIRCMG
jgi:hypothetical protein